MTTRTIDILLNMHPDQKSINRTQAGIKDIEKALKRVEQQANQTREKMEKLGNVGNKLALTGAAILAPFALAMNKYIQTAGETEDTSKRLVALGKRWEESQMRIGRVTAEVVLPALEKALDVIDKITAFAEANPGAVKAALGIGGTLVVLGGMLSTAASIVSTIATVQGLLAGAGIGAGAGAAGVGAALAPALTAALTAAAPVLAIAIGAEIGRQLVSVVAGEEYTWKEIGQDLKNLVVMSAEGWDVLFNFFGLNTNISAVLAEAMNTSDLYLVERLNAQSEKGAATLANAVRSQGERTASAINQGLGSLAMSLQSFGMSIKAGLAGLFSKLPGFAEGGEISGPGVFMGGEKGREFVLSNSTTRAAESLLGGRLTQDRLLSALGGRKISYYDARRFDASVSSNDRRMIRNETLSAISEALG